MLWIKVLIQFDEFAHNVITRFVLALRACACGEHKSCFVFAWEVLPNNIVAAKKKLEVEPLRCCKAFFAFEQDTSHVTFSRWFTRTRVAHVVSLACAHHIPCVISMRSCCVICSLRLLHFSFLSTFSLIILSFLPAINFIFHECGGQIPCALPLM